MDEQRQTWRIAGVDTTVYDSGPSEGSPTVVMVHGGDPRSLSNALDWSTVWSPGAIGARLVAYDKPGQGLTYTPDLPASAMTGDGLTAHLEEIVDRLPVSPIVLVGHSRGALPAADVARRRQDRVAGLVLVASNTLAPPSSSTPQDFYPRAYADPPPHPTEEYVRREPTMNSWSDGHVDEPFVAGRMRAALATGDRPCTSLVVNRSGHYVYRERPEAFLAALGAFVRSLPEA